MLLLHDGPGDAGVCTSGPLNGPPQLPCLAHGIEDTASQDLGEGQGPNGHSSRNPIHRGNGGITVTIHNTNKRTNTQTYPILTHSILKKSSRALGVLTWLQQTTSPLLSATQLGHALQP